MGGFRNGLCVGCCDTMVERRVAVTSCVRLQAEHEGQKAAAGVEWPLVVRTVAETGQALGACRLARFACTKLRTMATPPAWQVRPLPWLAAPSPKLVRRLRNKAVACMPCHCLTAPLASMWPVNATAVVRHSHD